MFVCSGYAAADASAPLQPFSFDRRDPGPTDIRIDILYCGVCHSDLHYARNEWAFTVYPAVPGHEIVGRVAAVGAQVTAFKPGDYAGVGCIVDSCRHCAACTEDLEQYCENGMTGTYGSIEPQTGQPTRGGYSKAIVVDQAYALRISGQANLAAVAPLLCAGITTYSPLKHWHAGPGKKIGVVGLGGLGHMAVKFAAAFGAHVTVFTTSPNKIEDAKKLGAHAVIVSTDPDAMAKEASSFDLIIDAVGADHNVNAYLLMLKRDCTMVQVGAPEKPLAVAAFPLIMNRRNFAGSCIGGIAETQEMLDFCAEHGITADIELIRMDEINHAFERMLRSDVKYRFVIDMSTLA
jgi:uncharacterized zinc-type alcohol dehydrogenase-like protein